MGRQNSFLAYLIACCAGWLQRQQAEAIEHLKSENPQCSVGFWKNTGARVRVRDAGSVI